MSKIGRWIACHLILLVTLSYQNCSPMKPSDKPITISSSSTNLPPTSPSNPPANSLSNSLDALTPGHWIEIANSKLRDALYNGPLAPALFASSGPTSIVAAWSGGAYDTKRDRLIIWGGGHTDYAGNEIYTFDLNSLKWNLSNNPSDITGYNGTSGIYPDGRPASRHTYDGLVYLPNVDRFFAVGGSIYQAGWTTPETWLFDFVANTWSQASDALSSSYGNIAAYDSASGHVWLECAGSHGFLQEFDPINNSWISHGNQFDDPISDSTTGAIDPNARMLVSVGAGSLHTWNLSSATDIRYNTPSMTGDPGTVVSGNSPGFVWYPPGNIFVAWNGGATIYSLDPQTWRWTAHPAATDNAVTPTAPAGTGTFGRFQYVPSKNVFILVNSIDQNVFAYKPNF